MLNKFFAALCIIVGFFASSNLFALSPIGQWVTYDLDETPRTIVEIYESGDTLSGKIVKELNPEKGKTYEPICSLCAGENKDKPKLGMVILTGIMPKNDKWVNGTILDPDTGKSYSSKITMDSEDKLNFRAYVGIPLFGKTIVWTRAQKNDETPLESRNN